MAIVEPSNQALIGANREEFHGDSHMRCIRKSSSLPLQPLIVLMPVYMPDEYKS